MKNKTKKGNKLSKFDKDLNFKENNLPLMIDQLISGRNVTSEMSKSDTSQIAVRGNLITLNRTLLERLFFTFGIVRNFVKTPVIDSYRGWVKIKSHELNEAEMAKIEKKARELEIHKVFTCAVAWARLFGGSAILIDQASGSNGSVSTEKLKIQNLKLNELVKFTVVDRWEFTVDPENNSPHFGVDIEATNFFFYGKKIDKSRAIKFVGEEPGSLYRPQLMGWGLSELEFVIRELNLSIKNKNVLFELLDEAKIDIFKIRDFNQSFMSADRERALTRRLDQVAKSKKYLDQIAIDAEDDYESKQLNFSGLDGLLVNFREELAAAFGIPMVKLFGLSPGGFSSGVEDIENYNVFLEGIRGKYEKQLVKLYGIICQLAIGFVPEDLEVEYRPLRTMTAEQIENVKNSQFDRLITAFQAGLLTEEEFKRSANVFDIFPIKLNAGNQISISADEEDE